MCSEYSLVRMFQFSLLTRKTAKHTKPQRFVRVILYIMIYQNKYYTTKKMIFIKSKLFRRFQRDMYLYVIENFDKNQSNYFSLTFQIIKY